MALWEDDENEEDQALEAKRAEYLHRFKEAYRRQDLKECSRLDREGSHLFPVRLGVAYFMEEVAKAVSTVMEEHARDAR